jgi:ribosome-associated protein
LPFGRFRATAAKDSTQKEAATIFTPGTDEALSSFEIKALIEQSLDADKADDIVTIDLTGQSAIADYMVVASGTSSRHVAALAEKLKKRLEIQGVKGIRMEGLSQADWVVMDAGDVIVHLFRPEVREFYNLEKMWGAFRLFDAATTKGERHIPA